MATYNRFSPYQATNQTWYLDHYTPVTLKPASDDTYYVIPDKYHSSRGGLQKTCMDKNAYITFLLCLT